MNIGEYPLIRTLLIPDFQCTRNSFTHTHTHTTRTEAQSNGTFASLFIAFNKFQFILIFQQLIKNYFWAKHLLAS